MSRLNSISPLKMKIIVKVLTIAKYTSLVSILILLLMNIYILLQPDVYFEAIKESGGWVMIVHITNNFSTRINIPYTIMQQYMPNILSEKYAYLLFSFVSGIMRFAFFYLSTVMLIKITKDTITGLTPFAGRHIKGIKLIALFVLIWFGLKDLILNVLFNLFITKIFYINLSNVHLTGFLIGAVIYLIAEIFSFGMVLQEDIDAIV